MAHPPRPPARPVFFNLMQIQMPVGALASIGHRLSGVLLAAGLPAAVWLLDISLRDEQGFAEVTRCTSQAPNPLAVDFTAIARPPTAQSPRRPDSPPRHCDVPWTRSNPR
jgi:hypothetical protein